VANARLVQLDEHGYPEFLDAPVPFWLSRDAKQAVDMCPALALSLTRVKLEPGLSAPAAPVRESVPDLTSPSPAMQVLTKRARPGRRTPEPT
jgi:hypothetical protein